MPYIPGSVRTSPLIERVTAALGPPKQGKVRAQWDLGQHLLMVATDRISAFDYVLADTIDQKGAVLNALTINWLEVLKDPHHHLAAYGSDVDAYLPDELRNDWDIMRVGQIVKKKVPAQIECIARGYLTGSGYKDYLRDGEVCGVKLPPGLRDGDRLPESIFTPSTKADTGHDANITESQAAGIVGTETVKRLKERTLLIYDRAQRYANDRGFVIADTKFEFDADGCLIDEVLTPDSSRFWTEEARLQALHDGVTPPSHDKQVVRDYLASVGFKQMAEGQREAFRLPGRIRRETTELYLDTTRFLLLMSLNKWHQSRGIPALV